MSASTDALEFSHTQKIGNIGITANFPYICSFRLYMQHVMLVNVKLDISILAPREVCKKLKII